MTLPNRRQPAVEAGEFKGGAVPRGMNVWTVFFGDDGGCEELDIIAPARSSLAEVRAIAEPIIKRDYLPGLVVLEITEFNGAVITSL